MLAQYCSARAHRARFDGRDQCAVPQRLRVVALSRHAGEDGLGVVDRVDVGLGEEDRLVVGGDEQRGERVVAGGDGGCGGGVGGAEVVEGLKRGHAGKDRRRALVIPSGREESRPREVCRFLAFGSE